MNFEDDIVIKELIERLKKKQIIPFVGAGMSKGFGFPLWKDLAINIIKVIGDPEIDPTIVDKRDLMEVFEFLVINQKRKGINDILKNFLKISENSLDIPETHKNLIKLGAPIIYTTNWDNLIELTYKKLEKPYKVVETLEDFQTLKVNTPTIFKFHGSLTYPDSLVITESNYYERFGIDSPFDIRFRSDLFERSLLLLGTSFKDYNLRYLWNRTQKTLTNTLGYKPPSSYLVAVDKDIIREAVLKENNIITINLDNIDEFPKFLKYLADNVDKHY